jgi:hypothetical protein
VPLDVDDQILGRRLSLLPPHHCRALQQARRRDVGVPVHRRRAAFSGAQQALKRGFDIFCGHQTRDRERES